MTTYPYQGRDLFAFPETYAYAQCDAPDYLTAWRASRCRALASMRSSSESETSLAPCGGIPLRALLAGARNDLAQGADPFDVWSRLQAFVRKYEVFKRLFSHYDEHGRRHPDAICAAPRDYLWLADCLATVGERTPLLQPVSTLLKLCDALCSRPEGPYSPADLHLLAEVLRREQALVERYE